jgi:2-isopropylmalate synthase
MQQQLIIFDTTMRDGEQSPGAAMSKDDKVRIGRQLEKLRVDVIEAGFAASSPGDFEAIRAVADAVKDSTVCSLARANDHDVTRAARRSSARIAGRVHTFIATSPIHMKLKLRMEPEAVLEAAVRAVTLARNYTDDVEFSAEDAVRSDVDFLCRSSRRTIKAGARTINVPDTGRLQRSRALGRALPPAHEPGAQCRTRRSGPPTATTTSAWRSPTSLAAVMAGARQVECTINGLGERAGNASLEEIVMAVRTRSDILPVHDQDRCDANRAGLEARLHHHRLPGASPTRRSSAPTRSRTSRASTRTACSSTARPTRSCAPRTWAGAPTPHARQALGAQRLPRACRSSASRRLGRGPQRAFGRFKELADKKREIFDEDIQALFSDEAVTPEPEHYKLVSLVAHSETGEKPYARIVISEDGRERRAEARGDGLVDAAFQAIESLAKSDAELLLYSVNNITTGSDAQGEVTCAWPRRAGS